MNTDRQIRLFVSSTFLDMQAERNHLVTVIFPQLRRLCESRGVTWGEVDLRWGVTDEDAAEGRILPICLEEINRCRPYFISLLGERYGWVPQNAPSELLEAEGWLREQLQERKSVTEMEILHAALRNPANSRHIYFYFRDPVYVQSVPEPERRCFLSQNPEDQANLKRLKERIRQSGLPFRDNYPDPRALGELVLADLTAVINQCWPEGSLPDPLTREALDHAAYARCRERIYIGRPEYFARLDAHVADGGDLPLVILGESGSGKSALLANWAALYRKANPDDFVLDHYIGATPASADWSAMLRRIMGEFKQRLNLTQEIPEHADALRSAFSNWLHMASQRLAGRDAGIAPWWRRLLGNGLKRAVGGNKRIIILLDGLNQLQDRDGAPDLLWLPPVMPKNVHLIASTLPGRALDEISKRHWPVFKVEPLTNEERRNLIVNSLAQHAKKLSPARVDRIASAPQSANPLYLRVLSEELRIFGVHERLEERIGYYLDAASPYELYGKVLTRWEEDYGTDIVRDTLSSLWAARRGLSESELLDVLGRDCQPLPRATWSPLFLAMTDALVSRGGLLTFAHDFLRTAARDVYLASDASQQQAHIRLADYFEHQPSGPRRTEELPWQLAEAGAWPRLYSLLANRVFLTTAWEHNEFEVRTYWSRIETASTLRMVRAYNSQIAHPEAEPDKDYIRVLSLLLGNAGHPEEALGLRSALTQHFGDTGDRFSLQASLGLQALIAQDRGDWDGAMVLHREQERICRSLGDLDGLAVSFGNQALILRARGDLDGAMALHQEQERICRQLGDLDGLQTTLGNQALVLGTRGDLDSAMALHKEEERICRQLGNLDGLTASLGHQALILRARGDLDGAMLLHKEEERICRQLGNLKGLSTSLGNQATILMSRGDLTEATAMLKEQQRICQGLDYPEGLSASLSNQASILRARGDLDGAMALHKEGERICRRLGYLDGLQGSLGNQAVILLKREDLDGAMSILREQERICRQLGNLDSLAISLGGQALVLQRHGDLDGAMALHKEQERICRQLGKVETLATSLGNQAVILKERGDLEGAMTLFEEQEKICRELGNLDGMRRALGNQAVILKARGDLNGAMSLQMENERICRKLGNIEGLALCLVNQGLVLQQMGHPSQGLSLAEEGHRLATRHGYTAIVNQITPILDFIRRSVHE